MGEESQNKKKESRVAQKFSYIICLKIMENDQKK